MFKVGDKVVLNQQGRKAAASYGYVDSDGVGVITQDDGPEDETTSNRWHVEWPRGILCFGSNELKLASEADPSMKPTNPKDALGSDKLPLHLWPMSATAFGCIGLANGMTKYGRHNWREAGIRPSIYVDACVRHLTDWFEGNESDPEDGVHNLSAAIACIAILIDASVSDKLNDDRNHNGVGWRRARDMMEPHVKRLKEMRKDKNPKHYTIADTKPDTP